MCKNSTSLFNYISKKCSCNKVIITYFPVRYIIKKKQKKTKHVRHLADVSTTMMTTK